MAFSCLVLWKELGLWDGAETPGIDPNLTVPLHACAHPGPTGSA